MTIQRKLGKGHSERPSTSTSSTPAFRGANGNNNNLGKRKNNQTTQDYDASVEPFSKPQIDFFRSLVQEEARRSFQSISFDDVLGNNNDNSGMPTTTTTTTTGEGKQKGNQKDTIHSPLTRDQIRLVRSLIRSELAGDETTEQQIALAGVGMIGVAGGGGGGGADDGDGTTSTTTATILSQGTLFDFPKKLHRDTFSLCMFQCSWQSTLYSIAICLLQWTVFTLVLMDLWFKLEFNTAAYNFAKDNGLMFRGNVAYRITPCYVNQAVRGSQILATLISVMTQNDLRVSVNLWKYPYKTTTIATDFPGATFCRFFLTSTSRFAIGMWSIFVSFLLVISSDNVLDVLLNFAAIEVISHLDDYAFLLGCQGYFGPAIRKDCHIVTSTRYSIIQQQEERNQQHQQEQQPTTIQSGGNASNSVDASGDLSLISSSHLDTVVTRRMWIMNCFMWFIWLLVLAGWFWVTMNDQERSANINKVTNNSVFHEGCRPRTPHVEFDRPFISDFIPTR